MINNKDQFTYKVLRYIQVSIINFKNSFQSKPLKANVLNEIY